MNLQELDLNGWGTQAGGALRGAVLGVFRVITRPAQMKVIVYFAKKKWKNRSKATEVTSKPDGKPFFSNVAVEMLVGAAMFDAYDRAYHYIEKHQFPGGAYFHTATAGAFAGCCNALLSTPHNNIVQWHADTGKAFNFNKGKIVVTKPAELFKGVRHACIRDTAAVSAMFSCTLYFKRNLPQPPQDSLPLTTLHAFTAGGLAGMVSTVIAIPFTKAAAWDTQYPGTHFLTFARKLALRDAVYAPKYFFVGAPPAVLAAFLPNAMGMAAMHLSGFVNKAVEDEIQNLDGYTEGTEKTKDI
eukprot:TRINITY_DN7829_c0_g1_i3.p1 TRINITY_DN7829_c0_g1~~TRINITY_DN7829_c0_g1_i3.p1  ORF type:complete len:299 (+),score=45.03 TRINITY_DN7829_c0_g1_i3:418-1314(+)